MTAHKHNPPPLLTKLEAHELARWIWGFASAHRELDKDCQCRLCVIHDKLKEYVSQSRES